SRCRRRRARARRRAARAGTGAGRRPARGRSRGRWRGRASCSAVAWLHDDSRARQASGPSRRSPPDADQYGAVAMTGRPPPRSTAHDLERYAGLFAQRTKVMKSSAMRDLMALTERAEVISLAGGLPDTSTFPPDSYAALMSTVAAESCARALQYGPTEGLQLVKRCIAEVMATEGMELAEDEVLVTTGGQQVIDLVCKTLLD